VRTAEKTGAIRAACRDAAPFADTHADADDRAHAAERVADESVRSADALPVADDVADAAVPRADAPDRRADGHLTSARVAFALVTERHALATLTA
jgi:hypothetical protein